MKDKNTKAITSSYIHNQRDQINMKFIFVSFSYFYENYKYFSENGLFLIKY